MGEANQPLIDIQGMSLEIAPVGKRRQASVVPAVPAGQRKLRKLILDDITLRIESGDSLALLGPNGAGKTTLLKCIAGLYHPTEGYVKVQGRVTSLINWSTGLDMEETGIENIYAIGYFLGLRRSEIAERVDEIVTFSGLGEYAYESVYKYSAGMVARLAFAVATSVRSDILLLDEGIGAGDAEFQEKANERVQELLKSASIVVLASHSGQLAEKYCKRGLYLNNGRQRYQGTVQDTEQYYMDDLAGKANTAQPAGG